MIKFAFKLESLRSTLQRLGSLPYRNLEAPVSLCELIGWDPTLFSNRYIVGLENILELIVTSSIPLVINQLATCNLDWAWHSDPFLNEAGPMPLDLDQCFPQEKDIGILPKAHSGECLYLLSNGR